jgi:hypothetical protein
MHSCPIPTCVVTALDDKLLMCRSHWRMVPPELQTAVWRAYNQVRDRRGWDQNRLEQLRTAQRNAIEAVIAKLKAVPA